MKPNFTLGIYQPEAIQAPPTERLSLLKDALANHEPCDLVVCPELFLSGYFVDDEIKQTAESQDGEFANSIKKLCEEFNCAIAYGYPEMINSGLANSAQCFNANGERLVNHQKTRLPHDYEKRYFCEGETPSFFTINDWRIGMLVCYEVEFPEHVRYYAKQGCDLVIAPTALTADWPVVSRSLIPTRAFENGMYVAYANHAGTEGDFTYLGESVIASPYGEDLARASNSADFIRAELDYDVILKHRERLPFLKDIVNTRFQ